MILSMTGFARREWAGSSEYLTWELRSVNHRFLDLSFRLPEDFRRLEPRFRRLAASVLRRGKVDCSLQLKRTAGDAGELVINEDLAARVVEGGRTVAALMDAVRPMSPLEILRWPGVVEERTPDLDPLHAAAVDLLESALDELGAARRQEGARLSAMLDARLAALDELVSRVRSRLPEASTRIRSKIVERVRQLGIDPSNERLEQELVLLAQRLDVDEELDRVDSHLRAMREALEIREPAGRRLDFLLQELNREANTLASKPQDIEITQAAVEMKVLIEQLREQVQNVE
ncbi:YicC family protein [soil metagenome]